MDFIDAKINSLSKSKFRGSFHLNKKMKEYCKEKGYRLIESHARDFITERLAPEVIPNDGKQTPTRQVHPVFIAQHACGFCCRGCLEKIHHIEKNRKMTENEINYAVRFIMRWIELELEK